MIGDMQDIVYRLKLVLPAQWFEDDAPVLNAVLTGLANVWSGIYTLLGNVGLQSRIATASGIFLDLAARDYFGSRLLRRVTEADSSYRARIQANLLAPLATRQGLVALVTSLTGRVPVVFEPLNAADTGGYTVNLGYNTVGGYGCLSLPYQFFLTAYRPNQVMAGNAGGYGVGPGGYNTTPLFYANTGEFSGVVSDAEIYSTIAGALPACGIAWTRLSN